MKTTEGKVVWCEGDEESGHGLREGRATAERPQWRSRSSSRHRIIEPATDLPIIYRTMYVYLFTFSSLETLCLNPGYGVD